MILKIFGFGLFLSRNSYFRNGWNILDFLVITGLVLSYSEIFPSLDFSILRSLRLLGPLRTIASFTRLQIILSALFSAMPLFFDALIILLFFYSIYAIIGLQLFSGILKFRCMDLKSGLQKTDELCGDLSCPGETFCVKALKNVDLDLINFDNVFSCFLQVIFIVTLDSWSTIMYSIQKAFTNYAWIYFISLVLFGSYMMNNLLLAIIKVKFSESQANLLSGNKAMNSQKKQASKIYDFMLIKREGLWSKKQKNLPANEQLNKKATENYSLQLLNLKLTEELTPLSKFTSYKKDSLLKSTNKSKSSIISNLPRRFSGNQRKLMQKTVHKGSIFSLISPSHKLSSEMNFSSIAGSFDENKQKQNNFQDKMFRALKDLATKKLKKGLLNFFNYSKMRKKRRHSRLFAHLQPEYLKLYVDHEKEYKSLSEDDVLMGSRIKSEVIAMEKQLSAIKIKKLPIVYTLKKESGLVDVLKKIYSKNYKKSSEFSSKRESKDLMRFLTKRFVSKTSRTTTKNVNVLKPLTERTTLSRVKTLTSKSPENKNNNVNLTIKIKKKEKKPVYTMKSMKKSLENFSIAKNRFRPMMEKDDDQLRKMLKQRDKIAFEHITNLIKAPIDNFEQTNEKIVEGELEKEKDEHEGELDMIQEYLRIRVVLFFYFKFYFNYFLQFCFFLLHMESSV